MIGSRWLLVMLPLACTTALDTFELDELGDLAGTWSDAAGRYRLDLSAADGEGAYRGYLISPAEGSCPPRGCAVAFATLEPVEPDTGRWSLRLDRILAPPARTVCAGNDACAGMALPGGTPGAVDAYLHCAAPEPGYAARFCAINWIETVGQVAATLSGNVRTGNATLLLSGNARLYDRALAEPAPGAAPAAPEPQALPNVRLERREAGMATDGAYAEVQRPRCGNGVVDEGEQCDPVADPTCPASCRWAMGTSCGNGIREATADGAGELCDDGSANSDQDVDACRTSCRPAGCGDGVQDTGETCDDGNDLPTDACVSCAIATCGDGQLWMGVEDCDLGPANSDTQANTCRMNCRNPHCGDKVMDLGEQCDDGNGINGDGCDDASANALKCRTTACGNGITTTVTGEECDDDNLTDGDGCDSNCTRTGCGNGITTTGEECDDRNRVSLDGCSATCRLEVCGDGIVQSPRENCEDNPTSGNALEDCQTLCPANTCSRRTRECYHECVAPPPEACDGVDNDCDGLDDLTDPDACVCDVQLAPLLLWPLLAERSGDTEFNGHGPRVDIRIDFGIAGSEVFAQAKVTMLEWDRSQGQCQPDCSSGSATGRRAYSIAATSLLTDPVFQARYVDNSTGDRDDVLAIGTLIQNNGAVASLACAGDTSGGDLDDSQGPPPEDSGCNIVFAPIKVKVRPGTTCPALP